MWKGAVIAFGRRQGKAENPGTSFGLELKKDSLIPWILQM